MLAESHIKYAAAYGPVSKTMIFFSFFFNVPFNSLGNMKYGKCSQLP